MKTNISLAGLLFASIALLAPTSAEAAIVCPSPEFPPSCGEYRTPSQVYAVYLNPSPQFAEIVLQDVGHHSFRSRVITPLPGGDELEEFESTLEGVAFITPHAGASFSVPFVMNGPGQTIAEGKTGNTTGTFDTEMISMSLSGNIGGVAMSLRESPFLSSLGQATITDIGGGLFEIDSFIDLFTELSVDGGSFVPAIDPSPIKLVLPEPSHALLCFLGFAVMGLRRRRA